MRQEGQAWRRESLLTSGRWPACPYIFIHRRRGPIASIVATLQAAGLTEGEPKRGFPGVEEGCTQGLLAICNLNPPRAHAASMQSCGTDPANGGPTIVTS